VRKSRNPRLLALKIGVPKFEMDVGGLTFAAAAVIPYSTHRLLFLKTTTGEEFTVPAYLPVSESTTVYGKKSSTTLPTTAYCTLPAADIVALLRECEPPLHGLDRMCTRGKRNVLYSRTGLEEVIPRRKRQRLGWRWPTEAEYIFKLPVTTGAPITADSTTSLSVLAVVASLAVVADVDTTAVESFTQILTPADVDCVTVSHLPSPEAPNLSTTAASTAAPCALLTSPTCTVMNPIPSEAVVSAQLFHPVQYSSPSTTRTRVQYAAEVNAVLDAIMEHAQSLPGAPWSMHPHQHSSFPSCTFGSFVAVDRESSTRLERGKLHHGTLPPGIVVDLHYPQFRKTAMLF
jgi:hypothetical protein